VHGAARRGASGICLAATRLATPGAAVQTLPLFEAATAAELPVFIHPGPAAGSPGDPSWWAPATSYVAQQHSAWHAFHAFVRPELPGACAVFALLAGIAPLHLERSLGRGWGVLEGGVRDPRCLYDTSSYGPRAVLAVADLLGADSLLFGSDYPVAPVAREAIAVFDALEAQEHRAGSREERPCASLG